MAYLLRQSSLGILFCQSFPDPLFMLFWEAFTSSSFSCHQEEASAVVLHHTSSLLFIWEQSSPLLAQKSSSEMSFSFFFFLVPCHTFMLNSFSFFLKLESQVDLWWQAIRKFRVRDHGNGPGLVISINECRLWQNSGERKGGISQLWWSSEDYWVAVVSQECCVSIWIADFLYLRKPVCLLFWPRREFCWWCTKSLFEEWQK